MAFSEAAGRAPTVMLEHRNFVKKLVFAVETLPVNLVVAGLVSELFAILLYLLLLLILRGAVPPTALWLPLLILPQILFTAGLSWFLAALGVFVRDLGQVIGFLLTIWFFLTPICYPESSLHSLPGPVTAWLSPESDSGSGAGVPGDPAGRQGSGLRPLWKLWAVSALVSWWATPGSTN